MEFWCFVALGFHCMHVPEGDNQQRAIIFNDGEYLQMDVRLEYLPFEYHTYAINLINSPKNTTTFKYTFIDGKNTLIIKELLIREYNNAVVKIVFASSNGKGKLIREFAKLIYSESSAISSACTKERCAIDLAWLKSYPPAEDDESTYRYTAATIKKQLHVVSFKDWDHFTVALGFKNTPAKIDHFNLIFAYGRENDSRTFIAGFNSNQHLVLNKTFDQAYLKIRLCRDEPCGVSDTLPVILFQYNDRRTDQNCLATRCNIILDFGDEESRHEYPNDESAAGSVANNEVADFYRKWTWLIAVAIGAAALVLTLGVVMVLRRRIKRGRNDQDEDIYATAQVTYAELELSPDSDRGFSKKEESPYAVIAGTMKPVFANKK